ncbi:HNH endonuclease [Helicobacter pylori]|uniref:HNH endonuclease n=1 Tax=Helicobacter pylori TaxID=210 RepID=UPI00041DD0B9|nr:HNH endonuclease [Helicobacter pylori]
MAEWKTDTEEVKRVVKACRDFKKSLQEEKCGGFIKDLDRYAREIQIERRKIEMQLQGAREELRKAKRNEDDARFVLRGLQVGSFISLIFPPVRIAAAGAIAAAEMVLKFMKEDTEKCKRNVDLLERAFEIYSNQARASRDLVEGSWEGVKSRLGFYTDRHQEFIKRSGQASAAIDEKYDIVPPESLKERDFESPTIFNSANKKVCDERLKDLREDFSFSLYAELKDKISASSHRDCATTPKEHGWDLMSVGIESLTSAKKHCAKNIKEALNDFTEKVKKSPNDLNAMNEAFNRLKTELERVTNDEQLKGLRENLSASLHALYAELKDKIHQNALSGDELERMIASKEREFEKNLEDLMPSDLSVHAYNESLTLAKKHCIKNCKKALESFMEKIKESPNDLNALNEAFDQLETELEGFTENLSQKIAPVLERYETYKQRALDYGEFLESKKEGFIADEKNPYPEEVKFNELRLAEFDSVFSVIVPLENLSKTACAHHALKALQATDKDLGFDAIELEQIAKGFIPSGYLWHFDANILGNVALVREELLLGVKHTKGYSLWKQFLQTQN